MKDDPSRPPLTEKEESGFKKATVCSKLDLLLIQIFGGMEWGQRDEDEKEIADANFSG